MFFSKHNAQPSTPGGKRTENVFENALERIEKKLNWEVNTGCSPAYLNFTGLIEDVITKKIIIEEITGSVRFIDEVPCRSA